MGLVTLCVSAIVLWWRRRNVGVLGAPLPIAKAAPELRSCYSRARPRALPPSDGILPLRGHSFRAAYSLSPATGESLAGSRIAVTTTFHVVERRSSTDDYRAMRSLNCEADVLSAIRTFRLWTVDSLLSENGVFGNLNRSCR